MKKLLILLSLVLTVSVTQAQKLGIKYDDLITNFISENKNFSTSEKEFSRYITETDGNLGIYTTYSFPYETDICDVIQISFTEFLAYNIYLEQFNKDFKSIKTKNVKKWYHYNRNTNITIVFFALELTPEDIDLGVVGKIRITNLGSIYDK